jgi:hypothetical protein
MPFTPRVSASGAYRDCKWCGGRGCLSCEVEADKEYKRQFPDGPKPLATFPVIHGENFDAMLTRVFGATINAPVPDFEIACQGCGSPTMNSGGPFCADCQLRQHQEAQTE